MAIVNTLIGGFRVKQFLSETPSITRHSLFDFKSMVKQQMYQSLLQIVLLGSVLILGGVGIYAQEIGFITVLFFNGVVILLSVGFKSLETRAQSMVVEDESLELEYQAICETWVKKALPDF